MASPERAPAPVDNVTDLGQARRRRSARQPAGAAVAPRVAEPADNTNVKPAVSGTGADAEPAARAKPARRKPGNRRFDRVKVDRLKAEIAEGSYEIDAVRVADKFIEHERR